VVVDVPGREPLDIHHLVLDVNGTLAERGELVAGVVGWIHRLRDQLEVTIATADTFGTARRIAAALGIEATVVPNGAGKAALVDRYGAAHCAAIGNGENDIALLERAGLSVVVLGREGASTRALLVADVVCRSITDALDLLLEPKVLTATLRA
jgi:P-type E1-E2 ATPase